MAFQPGDGFKVMRYAYRHGVLGKINAISGRAIEEVMSEHGLIYDDLLNRMDEASEETVRKIDGLLDRSGSLLRYAANDRLMKMISRLLDLPFVKRFMVNRTKSSISRTVTGKAPPSIPERVKAALAVKSG